MRDPLGYRAPQLRAGWGAAALQILGLAGTSHLLYSGVAFLPGFDSSGLAALTARFAESGPREVAGALLAFALLPALLEELLFRGLAFGLLDRVGGTRLAIVGSALLFGVAHLDLHHGLVAGALGLQLGALRHVHGLALAVAAHFVNNALALLVSAFVVQQAEAGAMLESAAGRLITLSLAVALAGSACAALARRLRSSSAAHPIDRTDLQTARGSVD